MLHRYRDIFPERYVAAGKECGLAAPALILGHQQAIERGADAGCRSPQTRLALGA
ncbi:MAG: hypothetical protein U0556_19455 [Dehalococcoidia bacterium]